MISIDNIYALFPKDNYTIKNRYKKIKSNFLKNKIGSLKLPRFKKSEKVVDFCYNLTKKVNLNKYKNKIKLLIICTQNPDFGGLPHNSAILHGKLKLKNDIATMDISQGCAGYLYGLVAAQSFLKEDEYCFFYTCDPYSKIIDINDLNTDILFGDAGTLSILQKKSSLDLGLAKYKFYTFGDGYEAIIKRNNILNMSGKDVMNFCEREVVQSIENFIHTNRLDKDKIGHFYFHQGSKHIVNLLTKKLDIKKDKISFLPNIGNTVSSSIPILMKHSNFKRKKNFIICGFGVGLSISIGYFC